MKINKKNLLEAIEREYKCSSEEALKLSNYTNNLDHKLEPALKKWITDGTIIEFFINDINFEYIMKKLNTSFLPSLIHMNKFIKNPTDTKKLKKLRIMNKDCNIN
ncbi:MAG: hypothetical protein ABF289_17355 [Clostridiales bacterium]